MPQHDTSLRQASLQTQDSLLWDLTLIARRALKQVAHALFRIKTQYYAGVRCLAKIAHKAYVFVSYVCRSISSWKLLYKSKFAVPPVQQGEIRICKAGGEVSAKGGN